MKSILSICCLLALQAGSAAYAQEHPYKVSNTFHIKSEGGWDYLAVHENNLYVSHGTQVIVLDKAKGDSVGVIPNTTGVHGIAFANGKGYTTNGKLNNLTVFDLKTNAVLKQVAVGEKPDAIMLDAFSGHLVVCNGKSGNLSIVDPATDQVVATIALNGKPETAVSDDKGTVFVNLEDKNSIAVVDMKAGKLLHTWALSAEGPTGLAFDKQTRRLFAGCDKQLVVVNADNGKIVKTLPIGEDCDGVAFDEATKTIFAANGSGSVTIIKEEAKDNFKVVQTLATKTGARTITLDPQTHIVYLPTAEFQQGNFEGKRPPMVPGTFQVLAVK
ncbi:YncE family protein [Chitinophaga sp. Cy-1792]|uniref:YncE family protein n=1 Tax=Chitinophaga sp. Cy-1792 TaxID=2608339 RepID=UPI001423B6DB|nr:YncE family protein [Chitinophaga sp. Cy-1792]NIG55587.1 YncE family protein [Chitinophaga sp. Cy-1792]